MRVTFAVRRCQDKNAWFSMTGIAKKLNLAPQTVRAAYRTACVAGLIDDTRSRRRRNPAFQARNRSDSMLAQAAAYIEANEANGVRIGCDRLAEHLGVPRQWASVLIQRARRGRKPCAVYLFPRTAGIADAIMRELRRAKEEGRVLRIADIQKKIGEPRHVVRFALKRLRMRNPDGWPERAWPLCPHGNFARTVARSEVECIDPDIGI